MADRYIAISIKKSLGKIVFVCDLLFSLSAKAKVKFNGAQRVGSSSLLLRIEMSAPFGVLQYDDGLFCFGFEGLDIFGSLLSSDLRIAGVGRVKKLKP